MRNYLCIPFCLLFAFSGRSKGSPQLGDLKVRAVFESESTGIFWYLSQNTAVELGLMFLTCTVVKTGLYWGRRDWSSLQRIPFASYDQSFYMNRKIIKIISHLLTPSVEDADKTTQMKLTLFNDNPLLRDATIPISYTRTDLLDRTPQAILELDDGENKASLEVNAFERQRLNELLKKGELKLLDLPQKKIIINSLQDLEFGHLYIKDQDRYDPTDLTLRWLKIGRDGSLEEIKGWDVIMMNDSEFLPKQSENIAEPLNHPNFIQSGLNPEIYRSRPLLAPNVCLSYFVNKRQDQNIARQGSVTI